MFRIQEAIKYGWDKFKANLQLSILTTLLTVIVGFVGDKTYWFIGIVMIVASIIIRIGYTKIFLKITDGESPKFAEIFQEYPLFWKYAGVSILQGLAMIGGIILLIIPGIIWGVRFSFAGLILIDTRTSPMSAMKESYAITKGKFWQVFWFLIVVGLINILGFIAFGIGLLVSIPISLFAQIYVYRELSKAKAGLIETVSPQSA